MKPPLVVDQTPGCGLIADLARDRPAFILTTRYTEISHARGSTIDLPVDRAGAAVMPAPPFEQPEEASRWADVWRDGTLLTVTRRLFVWPSTQRDESG